MFELNQSGIETRESWIWKRSPYSGLNWTKVELRHNTILCIYIHILFVWIEPKWNWDTYSIKKRGLDYSVWIEPKWNWDGQSIVKSKEGVPYGFELNQSGIETYVLLSDTQQAYAVFELNQSGIETNIPTNRWEPIFEEVWIEPKWNWDFSYHTTGIRCPCTLFELNQSGIETLYIFNIWISFATLCLNWTKVELRLLSFVA